MTQAPATPELVERLRSYAADAPGHYVFPDTHIAWIAADALEAQQARIAELEGAYQREARLVRAVDFECDEHLFALASERAAKDQAQALADRYEKALSGLIEYFEDGGAHDEGAYDESCPDCQTLQLARQALSSQGRHEGGEG